MPFETRNVEDEHRKKQRKENMKKAVLITSGIHFFQSIPSFFSRISRKIWIVFGSLSLVVVGGVWGYTYVSENSEEVLRGGVSVAAAVFGEDLKKNTENQTNILLLGSGGEGHEGGFLTDSIIIATLNFDTNGVSMISIPRDVHVRYSIEGSSRKGKINRIFMEAMEYWKYRLDTVEEQFSASQQSLQYKIEEILGDEIHYTVYIDFEGFVQVVDLLGGIEVNVEKRIYDDQYPGPNHTYRTFILPAGEQLLSGETALKYVRSRHGNAGGDFGRSYRQKKALVAVKEKAITSGILSSPSQIKSILGIISDHFWTNLSWQEMLSLAEFAQEIDSENIAAGGVQDQTNPNKEWFLYTPPRDLFGGQSVLLPCRINSKNPWSDIQHYHSLLTNASDLVNGNTSLSVFNTTKTPGIAADFQGIFSRFSIDTVEIGNAESREESVIEYIDEGNNSAMAEQLEDWFGIPVRGISRNDLEQRTIKEIDDQQTSSVPEDGQVIIAESDVLVPSSVPEKTEFSDIIIYLGEDYVEEYRNSVLWYNKCL